MTLAPHDTQGLPESNPTRELPTFNVPVPPASGSATPQTPTVPPAPPQPPTAEGTGGGNGKRPGERRPMGQVAGAALLAAVLASGGTYALTRGDTTTTATVITPTATATASANPGGTSPKVIQANAAAPDWSAVAKAVSPSVVSIDVTTQTGEGAGSGVVFDKAGHILTNNHVVEGATSGSISVTLADGSTYGAKVIGTDSSTDLAIIKLDTVPDNLTPISLGDSSALTVGDPVMAIGNPLGLSGTVTTGIISALDRPVSTGTSNESPFGNNAPGNAVVTNAIQTSAAINPGNSGGALVNASGQLIGINSAIASLSQGGTGSQSGNIGIGFAIPVNEAKSIANQLIKSGKAEHAFLGVKTRDTVTQDGKAKRAGAQISSVESGTPATAAGIKEGDVVIAVDGHSVDSSTALVAQIRERTAGEKVTVTLIRDGQRQDVQVTLAVKPAG